jgi:hypothetical protein
MAATRRKRSTVKSPAESAVRRARGRSREDAAFPAAPPRAELPGDYAETLGEIKRRIQDERLRVVLAANSAMVLLYWDVGRVILDRQERAGWGAKVIDRLAADLANAFPDVRGFSPRNLKYMRAFAAAWPDRAIVQQLAARIPWFRNCVILDRVSGLFCRQKNKLVVEYALRDPKKPIGVAEWETRIVKALPKELKGSLPTVEELEAELVKGDAGDRFLPNGVEEFASKKEGV